MSKTNIGYGGYKRGEFPFNERQKLLIETPVYPMFQISENFVFYLDM